MGVIIKEYKKEWKEMLMGCQTLSAKKAVFPLRGSDCGGALYSSAVSPFLFSPF